MEVSMSKTRRGKYTDNRICYISKCKGDMRLYLRRKGKLPCFSYLVRGKSFSFYRGKIQKIEITTKLFSSYFEIFLWFDYILILSNFILFLPFCKASWMYFMPLGLLFLKIFFL